MVKKSAAPVAEPTTPVNETEDGATRVGPMHQAFAEFLNSQHGATITAEQVFLVTSKRKAFRNTDAYRQGVKGAQAEARAAEQAAKEERAKAREEAKAAKEAEKAKRAQERADAKAKADAEKAAAAKAKAAETPKQDEAVATKPAAKARAKAAETPAEPEPAKAAPRKGKAKAAAF